MKITILTLFPEMFTALKESIIGRAEENGKLQINIVNIRDYAENKHLKCDDYPFGGGAGMVMMPQPIGNCINAADPRHTAHRIFMSPRGATFTQDKAQQLSQKKEILLLCGHYEGVDQRAIDIYIDEEISIGDFVLTGGEIPAMAVCDCISRLVDGVISRDSLTDESFSDGLLEYPQYTRPADYMGARVPEVLLSGDHGKVEEWRRAQSLAITRKRRPDLLPNQVHTMAELMAYLQPLDNPDKSVDITFCGKRFNIKRSFGLRKAKPRPLIYPNGYSVKCFNGVDEYHGTIGRFEDERQLYAFLGAAVDMHPEYEEKRPDSLKQLFESLPGCDSFSLICYYKGVWYEEEYNKYLEMYNHIYNNENLPTRIRNAHRKRFLKVDGDGIVHDADEELNTPEYAPFKRYLQRITVAEDKYDTLGGAVAKTFYIKLTPKIKKTLAANENLYGNLYNGNCGLFGLALYENGVLRYYDTAYENEYFTIKLK